MLAHAAHVGYARRLAGRRAMLAPLLCLCLLAGFRADAADVTAVRAAAAPLIDGRLDDACWRDAPATDDFRVRHTQGPASLGSSVRVAFDDAALYVGVRCEEPDVGSIVTRELERDNSDVFRTDCVEVMLDPARTRNDYYHIGVNASGSVADRACTQGGFIGDMSWDAPVTAASFIGDGFWSCEIAIPFYALGITPAVGSTWAINVCREKKSPAENSSIADEGAFNNAAAFPDLLGIDADLSRYCYTIGAFEPTEAIREGALELTLGVPVENLTGDAGERLLDGWLIGPGGEVVTASAGITPPVRERQCFELGPMRLAEQGEYECFVRVADPVTKITLALRQATLPIAWVPMTIRLVEPWYRDAIFATQQIEQVVVEVGVRLDAAELAGAALQVRVVDDAGGQALATAAPEVGESARVSFDAAALPEGRMTIVAALTGADGEELARTTHPLRKLGYLPGEVWLGRDMNWCVDGEPFFLNGAWNYPEGFVPEYNAFSGGDHEGVLLLDTSVMNMLAYRTPSVRTDALSAEDAELLRAHVREGRDNPRLFAYYVSDEPEVSNTQASVLEEVYRIFADEDPWHPIIISNDSMHGLHAYARCGDINGLHPYPAILRDRRINDLSSVAVFVEGAVAAFAGSDHKQTVAYLHQGFNYGDHGAVNNRIPSYVEYRDQDLLALICGARGFIQFNRMVAHYPELSIGMPHLTRELGVLGEVALSPTPEIAVTADSDSAKLLLKEHEGELWLLAANADMEPREMTITVPGIGARAGELQVVSEGRSVPLDGDRLTDRFDTFEVHVYTTGEAPDLPTVAEIVAEIDAANEARRRPGNLAFQMFEGDGVIVSASSSRAGRGRRADVALWHVVDGVIDVSDRYHCLTWQDDTPDEFPDRLEIALPEAHSIGRVVVYPFEQSLRDYRVEASVDGEWREVAAVSGQQADRIEHEFGPVTTDRIRLVVTAANGPNSMVTEVEVYEP